MPPAALLLALLLASCASAPPAAEAQSLPVKAPSDGRAGLRFTVEPRVSSPGLEVTLVLRNDTVHEIGFNLCMSGLERRAGDAWLDVPQPGTCTRELNVVGAGREARYRRILPTGLAPGTYRFETSVEAPLMQSRMRPIFSEPFMVRR